MTLEKSKNQIVWLDTQLCEVIYNHVKQRQEKSKILGEPIPPFETRFVGVLESIIESVKLKSDLLSYDLPQIAVTYYVHFAKSQAFMNGNKRMSVIFTDIFLYLNGYQLMGTGGNLADLTLLVSEDKSKKTSDLVKTITPLFRKLIIHNENSNQ